MRETLDALLALPDWRAVIDVAGESAVAAVFGDNDEDGYSTGWSEGFPHFAVAPGARPALRLSSLTNPTQPNPTQPNPTREAATQRALV